MDVTTPQTYARSYCRYRCLRRKVNLGNLLYMRGRMWDGSLTNVCKWTTS
ncbi:hypothetical protein B0H65DRAFT_428761 [Neurospora tetraspora]|uniref:Uncharacterized protein n=1 Tax=Neurospora tetraspora TaxID=94610 RepID=A0AAE0MQP0_9PEZI|nr:hypothetical protein B0H65DRAFT_428761 [Neurospora tetraspora]